MIGGFKDWDDECSFPVEVKNDRRTESAWEKFNNVISPSKKTSSVLDWTGLDWFWKPRCISGLRPQISSRITPIGYWLRNDPRGSMYVNLFSLLHYFILSFLRASFGAGYLKAAASKSCL